MQLTDPASLSLNNAFASKRYLPIRIGKRHYLLELKKPKGALTSRKKDEQSTLSAGLLKSRRAW